MTRYLISFNDGVMIFPEEELPDVAEAGARGGPAGPERLPARLTLQRRGPYGQATFAREMNQLLEGSYSFEGVENNWYMVPGDP